LILLVELIVMENHILFLMDVEWYVRDLCYCKYIFFYRLAKNFVVKLLVI
jgi:hypothetical protein